MTPDVDPATLVELRRLARSRPRSGRGLAAKASAIRTLERLGRRRPVPAMPKGWHPGPPEFEELDRGDHPDLRERWWRNLISRGGAA